MRDVAASADPISDAAGSANVVRGLRGISGLAQASVIAPRVAGAGGVSPPPPAVTLWPSPIRIRTHSGAGRAAFGNDNNHDIKAIFALYRLHGQNSSQDHTSDRFYLLISDTSSSDNLRYDFVPSARQ